MPARLRRRTTFILFSQVFETALYDFGRFLMTRNLTFGWSAAPGRTRIRLRIRLLGILAYKFIVRVCVFGRRWSCGRPRACRHAARPHRKRSVFGGFSVGKREQHRRQATYGPAQPEAVEPRRASRQGLQAPYTGHKGCRWCQKKVQPTGKQSDATHTRRIKIPNQILAPFLNQSERSWIFPESTLCSVGCHRGVLPVDPPAGHIRTHPSRYNGCHDLRCFRRRGPPGLRRQDRLVPRARGRPRGAQARIRGDVRRKGRGDLAPCRALHLHRACPACFQFRNALRGSIARFVSSRTRLANRQSVARRPRHVRREYLAM